MKKEQAAWFDTSADHTNLLGKRFRPLTKGFCSLEGIKQIAGQVDGAFPDSADKTAFLRELALLGSALMLAVANPGEVTTLAARLQRERVVQAYDLLCRSTPRGACAFDVDPSLVDPSLVDPDSCT